MHTNVHSSAFTTAKRKKQPTRPSRNERIHKTWSLRTTEYYYLASKRKDTVTPPTYSATRMNLEDTVLSERSQPRKDKCRRMPLGGGAQKCQNLKRQKVGGWGRGERGLTGTERPLGGRRGPDIHCRTEDPGNTSLSKGASHRTPHVAGMHFCDMPRTGRSLETEGRWGGGAAGEGTSRRGHLTGGGSWRGDGRLLELDNGDAGATPQRH